MLLVISPAKNLDYDTPANTEVFTQPDLLTQSQLLIDELKALSPQDISSLMKVSDKLGVLNYDRFQSWSQPFDTDNAKQAVLAFNGDVYGGLDAPSFDDADYDFAQQHLRILSGLYGVLRPLDLMQPYRLEMGTKFANQRGANLYHFWGSQVTDVLNVQLKGVGSDALINLASTEYFKAVKKKELHATIITPVFKDAKAGKYKVISFYAKKARGLMCAYIIKNRITEPEQIKHFDAAGYQYNEAMSSSTEWVFTREEQ